jgi:oligopeptide/dipeptide ABC transporter ATP-binding protein
MSTAALSVRGLTTKLAGRQADALVQDVSLDLAPGETLALVGESGCGKSTLALSIARLLPPSLRIAAGTVWLDGLDILAIGQAAMRRLRGQRIAMIFQDPMGSLNPLLTIGSQVTEAVRVHDRTSLSASVLRRRAERLLEEVGFATPARILDSYPHQLSGGECQRSMIAMALAGQPAVLIADEPLTALDPSVRWQMLGLLADIQLRHGTAILLITHDLRAASGIAHRIAVMYAGRIVETGPAGRLLADPRHPYTAGLLAACPNMDRAVARLPVIRGAVPRPGEMPAGCAFAPRCDFAVARCGASTPALAGQPGQPGEVACFRATTLAIGA